MGMNDTAEQLAAAIEEVGKLERENAELVREVRGQYQWGEIMKAERDAALSAIEQVRAWRDENQEHEVYEATEDQPEECTDECGWCHLDTILATTTRNPRTPGEEDR